jgi:Fibronectin type III domain
MLRRLGVAAVAAVASLAFAASAQAAPSTPILNPIPNTCASYVNVSWSPSTPEPGGTILGYRLDIGDLTTGTAYVKWSNSLSSTISGLQLNHQYVVRVRALQAKGPALSFSYPSGRTFKRQCLVIPQLDHSKYVAYNPFPECIMCGVREQLQIDDPVILRAIASVPDAPERFGGMELRGDGSVRFM